VQDANMVEHIVTLVEAKAAEIEARMTDAPAMPPVMDAAE
jgi:hypothetical protein